MAAGLRSHFAKSAASTSNMLDGFVQCRHVLTHQTRKMFDYGPGFVPTSVL